MKAVRCGNLKYFNLECEDLAQHPIKKICRLLQRVFPHFVIDYLPDINADILYVPEDVSPGMRALVKKAMEKGIKTVVIQHGIPQSPSGFVPLYADHLMCWPEHWLKFVSWGIPEDRLIKFTPQKPNDLRKIIGVDAVFFLPPPSEGRVHQLDVKRWSEAEILEEIRAISEKESNLLIKPHPKLYKYLKIHLKNYRVSWERAEDLIHSAKTVYCSKDCTITKDVEIIWGGQNDSIMWTKSWGSCDVVFFSRDSGLLRRNDKGNGEGFRDN